MFDDLEECEPLPCDVELAERMAESSARLLWRLNEVRGIPNIVQPRPNSAALSLPIYEWRAPKGPRLWPRWYKPPGIDRKTGNELLRSVGLDLSVPVTELRGDGRSDYLVEARAIVARILRDRGMSYPQIGRMLGGRDHSTVMHMINRLPFYAKRNPKVERCYQRHRARDAAQ